MEKNNTKELRAYVEHELCADLITGSKFVDIWNKRPGTLWCSSYDADSSHPGVALIIWKEDTLTGEKVCIGVRDEAGTLIEHCSFNAGNMIEFEKADSPGKLAYDAWVYIKNHGATLMQLYFVFKAGDSDLSDE